MTKAKKRQRPDKKIPFAIDFSELKTMDDSIFIPISSFKNEKALRGSISLRAKNYGISLIGNKMVEDGIEGVCYWRRR